MIAPLRSWVRTGMKYSIIWMLTMLVLIRHAGDFWSRRIVEHELHTQKLLAIPLPVHEKDPHSVVFNSNTNEMTILKRVQMFKTMLMGYFEANTCYPEACSYLYVEFPEHFV